MRLPALGFFATIIAIDVATHWYLWIRLFRDPGWPSGVKLAGAIVLALFAVALPAGMIISRNASREIARPIATAAYVWLGTAFYFLVVLFTLDFARWIATGATALWAFITSEGKSTDLVRRALLSKSAVGSATAAAASLSAVALRTGLSDVEVKDVSVKLDRLPRELSGMSIVQLTDIHVGPTIGERFMRTIVEKTNALKPDAVVITGDLVDGSVEQLAQQVAPLAKLSARFGVYFVTGNHEYYSGVKEWTEHLSSMGIRVLRNEKVSLGDGASIDLAGVDDHLSHELAENNGAELVRLLGIQDDQRELILLAHQPKAIVSAAGAGVGLQLSGHTHGGQLWPFSHLVALTQPYLAGLHRHEARTQIYVSRGTGYWGPPMRLLAPAEITRLVLG
jgi:predicted MPP superfamily phosphohydrolase